MLNPAMTFDPGTAQIPLSLLRRVARDDAFRDQMETDPAAALAQYGLEVDPALLPERVTLPDAAHLEEAVALFDDPEMGDDNLHYFHGFFAASEPEIGDDMGTIHAFHGFFAASEPEIGDNMGTIHAFHGFFTGASS